MDSDSSTLKQLIDEVLAELLLKQSHQTGLGPLAQMKFARFLPDEFWDDDAIKRAAQVKAFIESIAHQALDPRESIPKPNGDGSFEPPAELEAWRKLAKLSWVTKGAVLRENVLRYIVVCKYLSGMKTSDILVHVSRVPRTVTGHRGRGKDIIAEWILKRNHDLVRCFSVYNSLVQQPSNSARDDKLFEQHADDVVELIRRSSIQKDWSDVLALSKDFSEFLERTHRQDAFHTVASRAKQAAEQLGDVRQQLLYSAHLGWFHYRRGEFEESVAVLDPVLKPDRGDDFPDEYALAARTLSLALMYRGEKLPEAEVLARRALELWTSKGRGADTDSRWIERAQGTYGLIALRLKNYSVADDYLVRARAGNFRDRDRSEEGWIMNTIDLAELRRLQNRLDDAQTLLDEVNSHILSLPKPPPPNKDWYAYFLLHKARLTFSRTRSDLEGALHNDLRRAQTWCASVGYGYLNREIAVLRATIKEVLRTLTAVTSLPAPEREPPRLDGLELALKVVVEQHEAYEPLRRGSPRHYLAHTPDVFGSVASQNEFVPRAPLCVQLEITNKCSTKCTMCFRSTWNLHFPELAGKELSTERILELLAEFAEMGVQSIVLSGGEPVVHPNFVQILERAHDLELHVGILSNGVWPDPPERHGISVYDAIVRYADWIRLSVDGGTPETYQKVRLPMLDDVPMLDDGGGFHAIQTTLRRLSEAKQKHKTECKIGIAYTIQKANIENVHEMVEFATMCEDLAVEDGPVVVFKLAHGAGGSFLCNKTQLEDFRKEALEDKSMLDNDRVDLKYVRNYIDTMSIKNIESGKPLSDFYRDPPARCFTPYLFSLIDAFGNVYVCCHHYDDNGPWKPSQRDEYCLGSVVDDRFSAVWKSDKYNEMRKRLERINVDNMPPCSQCTRHYQPNRAMTQVYELIYSPIVEQYGKEDGLQIFRRMASHYNKGLPYWF